jgi:hypothetical protein
MHVTVSLLLETRGCCVATWPRTVHGRARPPRSHHAGQPHEESGLEPSSQRGWAAPSGTFNTPAARGGGRHPAAQPESRLRQRRRQSLRPSARGSRQGQPLVRAHRQEPGRDHRAAAAGAAAAATAAAAVERGRPVPAAGADPSTGAAASARTRCALSCHASASRLPARPPAAFSWLRRRA